LFPASIQPLTDVFRFVCSFGQFDLAIHEIEFGEQYPRMGLKILLIGDDGLPNSRYYLVDLIIFYALVALELLSSVKVFGQCILVEVLVNYN
jgi:hypothetical protein